MQPSSEPTSTAPGLDKRGFERSDRPLARRIDDQDSRHRRCARQGPLAVSLTGGHVHDVTQAQALTQKIEPAALLADKGYDSEGFIEHLEVRRIKPVIPPRANRKTPCECDFALYLRAQLRGRFLQHHQALSRHRNPLRKDHQKLPRRRPPRLRPGLAQMTTGPRWDP